MALHKTPAPRVFDLAAAALSELLLEYISNTETPYCCSQVMVACPKMNQVDQALMSSVLRRSCSRVRTLKGRAPQPGAKCFALTQFGVEGSGLQVSLNYFC